MQTSPETKPVKSTEEQPGKLPRIDNLVQRCFQIFPSTYWSLIYEERKKPEAEVSARTLFEDVFHLNHTPNKENNTTVLGYFCTIPPIPEAWEVVLAAYGVLFFEKHDSKITPSQLVAMLFQEYANSQIGDSNDISDRIGKFLLSIRLKKKGNGMRFFVEPERIVIGLLRFLEELGGNPGSGILTGPNREAVKVLKHPEFRIPFDSEYRTLNPQQ